MSRPAQPQEWRAALAQLPDSTIPAFWFAHGSPSLIAPDPPAPNWQKRLGPDSLARGRQWHFLKDFGPALLEKYNPKAILVFSAHWTTDPDTEGVLVSDYEGRNPILYDYYGFPPDMYELDFHSHGDAALSRQIVESLRQAGLSARLLGKKEPRGLDGRTNGPGHGIDHGIMVPFRLMFDDSGAEGFPVPVIQVSIYGEDYSPAQEQALGAAVRALRKDGVLILSGGLTYHNLGHNTGWNEKSASPLEKSWDTAVLDAIQGAKSVQDRHKRVADLEHHPGFRHAHPSADHFAPIWVAEGAGSEDAPGNGALVLSAIYGAHTIAFL